MRIVNWPTSLHACLVTKIAREKSETKHEITLLYTLQLVENKLLVTTLVIQKYARSKQLLEYSLHGHCSDHSTIRIVIWYKGT
jgi:hypothetical protein